MAERILKRRNHEQDTKGPRVFLPAPSEWEELGGIGIMMKRISDFLVFPRRMAFSLLSEEIIKNLRFPSPANMQPFLEGGRLEALIERNFARIHKSSWLDYSRENGWQSKGIAPNRVNLTDRLSPPRLTIYELGERSMRTLICSFRPTYSEESNMGRLGMHLRAERQTVFIGNAADEKMEITLPSTATREVFRRLEREPEAFFPHVEAAEDFIRNQREFNLDVWFPRQSDSGEMQNVKLFGAQFNGLTLLEIITGQE